MRNLYFSDKVRSEQQLYDDIVIESLKIYGQDTYYLPRDLVTENRIFGEDVPSSFNSSYKLEMYIENVEGFDGEGDLFTRFGVEIRDEATFVVSRRRWDQTVRKFDVDINSVRPREGDLIYLPLSNSMFEINHVEHEQPFYQLANLPVYKLRATLFEYNDEDLDTGVAVIDAIEQEYAYTYILTLGANGVITVGQSATQTLSDGTIIRGEVSKYSDSDNKLHLIHVGADDGDYHTFVTTETITVNDSSYSVTAVTEENKISSNEQNDDFQADASGFLDFSETNPFGDPS
jgi:archaellum component FlaF (FlaF/FlaG flagellin family)